MQPDTADMSLGRGGRFAILLPSKRKAEQDDAQALAPDNGENSTAEDGWQRSADSRSADKSEPHWGHPHKKRRLARLTLSDRDRHSKLSTTGRHPENSLKKALDPPVDLGPDRILLRAKFTR